jgi:hypothetical protein
MGLGFGFLKQMNDTMKYNRDILGKKKSVREIYKDEIKQRRTTHDKQNLEFIRQRVAATLKRNRTHEIITKTTAILAITILVLGTIWVLTTIDFKTKSKGKYEDKSTLFNTTTYEQPNGLKLKSDYFIHGAKAADTYYKAGLKHQNSESYYQSGEQFRSALYYYDSLVTDIYFYKSGDTIKNFPVITDTQVHHITLFNKEQTKKIEFDYYDGKLIKDTYKETRVDR